MKTLSTILMALILLVLCAEECLAQSTSSASQTVVFGVRRVDAPSLAVNSSQENSDGEPAALIPAPLKLTVGSHVRSEEFLIGTRGSVVKKTRRQQTISSDELVAVPVSQNIFRSTPPKSVITVTE